MEKMSKEREKIRSKQRNSELAKRRLQMAPRFTDLVKDYGVRVNGSRVELPISGLITTEEVNEAFFAGKTDAWDVVCFLVQRTLDSQQYLKGVSMEIEVEEEIGLKTIYLTDLGRKT